MNEPKMKIDEYGNKWWYLHDKLHREDGPAVEYADGAKSWYLHNKLHREDGPAVERTNGDKFWWLHGKRHREDGPAVECANGAEEWWLRGALLPCGFRHARAMRRLRDKVAGR